MSAVPSFLARERIVAGPGFNRWLIPPCALAVHLWRRRVTFGGGFEGERTPTPLPEPEQGALREVERDAPVARRQHGVARILEHILKHHHDRRFVVNDQDRAARHGAALYRRWGMGVHIARQAGLPLYQERFLPDI